MACMVRENTDRLTYPNCEGKKILTRQSGTNSTHAVVALRSCDWGQGKSVDGRGDDARLQLLMIVVVLVRGGKKGGLVMVLLAVRELKQLILLVSGRPHWVVLGSKGSCWE